MKASLSLSPEAPQVASCFQRLPLVEHLAEALHGQHVLLTGGTGFFGRWILALLYHLRARGSTVHVSVVSRAPERFLALHPLYRTCDWLSWLSGDVQRLPSLPDRPVDLLLHAATDTSAAAHAQPLELFDSIVFGARRMFQLALERGVRRILVTGSGAQYGVLPAGQPAREDAALACDSCLAASAYAEGKRAQETLAALYAKHYGVEVVMTRCFAFSGPGLPLDAHFALGNFVRDALQHEALVLASAGDAVRSYLHGADLAVWLLYLLLHGQSGEAYNVGSDQAVTIAELARQVAHRLAPHKPVLIQGAPASQRSYYVPDIGKARALGLAVWTSLDESIDSMGQWARDASDLINQAGENT